MATSTPKVPTNKDEEAALEKALAKYKRARVEAAKEFLAGPEVAALREKLDALLADGLPAGSAAHGNLSQMPGFLDQTAAGIEADLTALENTINPPAAPTLPGPTPMVPAPPVPLV